jgi:hypothetical protein
MRVAFILASATLAGAFGGAIAFGVGHMNQVGSMSAWRWLFILGNYRWIIAALYLLDCRGPAFVPIIDLSFLLPSGLPRDRPLAHRRGKETRRTPAQRSRVPGRQQAYDIR